MKMNTIKNIFKVQRLLFFIGIIFFLSSCSDVLENTYSKKTAEGDLERIQAIKRLDSAEYELLTDYMLRHKLIEPDLKHIDQSYKELLVLAHEERIKMERARENAKKIKNNKRQFVSDHMDHMHRALIMDPELSEIKKDYSAKSGFLYKIVFINPGEKAIKAFKGKFTFFDVFDQELKTVDLTYNDIIEPADTAIYVAPIDIFKDGFLFVSKDYKDVKVVWQPEKILYSDGSFVENHELKADD